MTTQAKAHEAAIGWLGSLGHSGASRCYLSARAPQSACTLSCTSALAHLRWGVSVTTAEALRDLVADARRGPLQLFYFTSGTYSETALSYAEEFDIALFEYDRAGTVSHVNAAAMTAILAGPEGATPPEEAHAAAPLRPTDAGRPPSAGPDPDLRAWAGSAWHARQAPASRRAFLAYLPLGVSVLVGLLALAFLRAWSTGAAPPMRVETLVLLLVAFHALCAWSVLRVARWRGRLREHRLHTLRACTVPCRARAVVRAAMQQSGRGVPEDHEAFVLLRNEVIELSGADAFTAGVVVWELTIGAARPAERNDWLGVPGGGDSAR